jgi:hypothetical protein
MTQPHLTKPNAARAALGLGFVILLAAGALFRTLLIPFEAGPGIWAVWGATVVSLVVGIFFAIRDVWRLARESNAIHKLPLLGTIEDYQTTVSNEKGPFANTLVADRVQRVAQSRELGATADAMRASFRSDAASRATTVGAITRYLASTLLLLSVIGTFAGMKAALPGLYSAVQQSSPVGRAAARPASTRVDINGQNIHDALKHVADAFGANFLALVGALVLSIVSFGATVDRRRVLANLELVSEQRLFRLLHSERQLVAQAFVDQLKESLTDVGTIATQIGELREAISHFTDGTTTAIETFQSSLNGQIRAEFLTAHKGIAEQVSKVVPELTRIADASHTTSLAYGGLVQGLRERDVGLATASETLRTVSVDASVQLADASLQLKGAIGPLGDLAAGITRATTEAHGLLGLIAAQSQLVNESLRAANAAAVTADELARTSNGTIEHLHRGTNAIVEIAASSGVTLQTISKQGERLERAAEATTVDLRRVAENGAAASKDLTTQATALSESNAALREVIDGLRTGIDETFIEIERRLKDRELYTAVQAATVAQNEVAKEIRELVATLRTREAATAANLPANGSRRAIAPQDAEVPPATPVYEPPPRAAQAETRSRPADAPSVTTPDAPRRPRTSMFGFWKVR